MGVSEKICLRGAWKNILTGAIQQANTLKGKLFCSFHSSKRFENGHHVRDSPTVSDVSRLVLVLLRP